MKKPISRKVHGGADYAYAALTAALPELVGFEGEEKAKLLARIISGGTFAYTLLTHAEWGLLKVIPFKIHLITDFTAGVFAISAPWIFKFAENKKARNTFLALGLTSVVASLLTQPEEMD
ncbi:MAG: SPW repeat domain-containing protein [Janthinobacterium lividum]